MLKTIIKRYDLNGAGARLSRLLRASPLLNAKRIQRYILIQTTPIYAIYRRYVAENPYYEINSKNLPAVLDMMYPGAWKPDKTNEIASRLIKIDEYFSDDFDEYSTYFMLHVLYEKYGSWDLALNALDWKEIGVSEADLEYDMDTLRSFDYLHYSRAGSIVGMTLKKPWDFYGSGTPKNGRVMTGLSWTEAGRVAP